MLLKQLGAWLDEASLDNFSISDWMLDGVDAHVHGGNRLKTQKHGQALKFQMHAHVPLSSNHVPMCHNPGEMLWLVCVYYNNFQILFLNLMP